MEREYDLTNFDWGWMSDTKTELSNFHRESMNREIFEDKIYEKINEVKEGDIVVDIGASVGPFSYSILHKNPKQIFCIEPSKSEFETLKNNLSYNNITLINKGISNKDGLIESDMLFGGESEMEGMRLKTFINDYNIDKIDFLKIDCEGGEYDFFNIDNLCWLKDNLKYVVGEWHLSTPELKQKFREFRDVFLRVFPRHEVFALCGANIKWDLWNEHFIEYYNEIILSIDNR